MKFSKEVLLTILITLKAEKLKLEILAKQCKEIAGWENDVMYRLDNAIFEVQQELKAR